MADESHGTSRNGSGVDQGERTLGSPRAWVTKGETCGANRGEGRPRCRMPAGWGTDHVGYGQCKYHGGRMRSNRVASAKAELAAVTGSQFMGLALEVSPA